MATFGRSQFKLPLSTDATDGGGVGGSVSATLALTLGGVGGPASFGAFQPGVARGYAATTTANVVSSAGDVTERHRSVRERSRPLVNGSFSLPTPVQAKPASPPATGSAFGPVGGNPLTLDTPGCVGRVRRLASAVRATSIPRED